MMSPPSPPAPWPDDATVSERSLEQELRSFPPAAPSRELRRRIEAAASEPPKGGRSRPPLRPWLGAAAALMAAGWLAAAGWWPARDSARARFAGDPAPIGAEAPTPPAPPSTGGVESWRQQRFVLDTEDAGFVEVEGAPPMRRVRYRLLNRTSWEDPENGILQERFMPEERIYFVPVQHH